MAVTPNYGWPVPVATDYVKDGWEAISDLGNAIDTTVAGLGSGLTLITSNTFTTASSVSAPNGTFSATYTAYQILIRCTFSSNGTNANLRLRASGTDNTTATAYRWQRINAASSTITASTTDTSLWAIGTGSTTFNILNTILIYPFATVETSMQTNFGHNDAMRINSGHHTQQVSYDSFSFFPDAGTITGKYWVYGLEG